MVNFCEQKQDKQKDNQLNSGDEPEQPNSDPQATTV